MKSLQTLFLDQLADIYYAEGQLVKALPKLAKAATHEDLRKAFEDHLLETEGQWEKLEEVFKAFGAAPKTKKCEAILGLIREGEELASEYKGSPAINAALVAAAQKVEHYEIATYGCLREWADVLDQKEAAELLGEILAEEKSADGVLTELARLMCNPAAKEAAEDSAEQRTAANTSRQASQALHR